MIILYVFLALFVLWNVLDLLIARKEQYGITFIAGEIGSGKSTYASMLAQKHLRKGWTVYSNFPIQGCKRFHVSQLEACSFPEHSLVIIDEASLEINSRNFAKTKLSMLEYFKISRHYKNKVVLISQTFTDTDKQIRDLSSKVLFIRNIMNGVFSMPLNVRGRIGVGQDGQPCVQYKIGKLGKLFFLPRWRKYFNSFERPKRVILENSPDWFEPEKKNNFVGSSPESP